MIHECGSHLSECKCPSATESLRKLAASDYVYVGNIIDARIRDGLNAREDFDGVNPYHPYEVPISAPYEKGKRNPPVTE